MTKRGRPPYEPTDKDRRQAKTLAAMGLLDDEIARVIGIAPATLRKHFAEVLDVGPTEATAQVAQALFKQATSAEKPNVIAAIFWLKARAGWRDHDAPSITGKKEERGAAAKEAAKGKYAPLSPPKLAVVKKITK